MLTLLGLSWEHDGEIHVQRGWVVLAVMCADEQLRSYRWVLAALQQGASHLCTSCAELSNEQCLLLVSSSPPALIEAHRAAVSPSTSERVALQASTRARIALNFSMAPGKLAVLLRSLTPR